MTRLSRSCSGTAPSTIAWARPSTIAVLPTPASPMSTGLFLVRRLRISIVCSISSARPMTGSSSPLRARSVRSVPNLSSIGVSDAAASVVSCCVVTPPAVTDSRTPCVSASAVTPASASTCPAGASWPMHEREEEVLGVDVGRTRRAGDLVGVEERAAAPTARSSPRQRRGPTRARAGAPRRRGRSRPGRRRYDAPRRAPAPARRGRAARAARRARADHGARANAPAACRIPCVRALRKRLRSIDRSRGHAHRRGSAR